MRVRIKRTESMSCLEHWPCIFCGRSLQYAGTYKEGEVVLTDYYCKTKGCTAEGLMQIDETAAYQEDVEE